MADDILDAFELLPADDPATDPANDLAAAEASVLSDPPLPEAEDPPLPFGRSWVFDFERGRFVRQGQSPAETTGLGALAQWCQMAVRTARYAHAVFSDDFGVEDPDLVIGEVRVDELIGEFEQQVREALLVHERIADVTEFDATYDPTTGTLSVTFTIVTDEDDELAIGNVQVQRSA